LNAVIYPLSQLRGSLFSVLQANPEKAQLQNAPARGSLGPPPRAAEEDPRWRVGFVWRVRNPSVNRSREGIGDGETPVAGA